MKDGKKKGQKQVKINQMRARVELECSNRGITLSEYARRLKRSPQGLNDLLNRNSPRLSTIEEMAQALGITVEQFLKPVTAAEYGEAKIPHCDG
jgi:transcriptional regulator with XRE-family HTH domain